MTMTIYRHDDPGAPVFSADSRDTLFSVLTACLVTGYGEKPAAGWSRPLFSPTISVYKQGAGSTGMCARFDLGSNVNSVQLRGYESMTYVGSGTGPFPTPTQNNYGVFLHLSKAGEASGTRPWLIAADSKRFYIWFGYTLVNGIIAGSTLFQSMVFFGDLISYKPGDNFHCAIMGATSYSESSGFFCACGGITNISDGHHIARAADQITQSVPTAKIVSTTLYGGGATIGIYGNSFPDVISGGLMLGRVYSSNGTVAKGLRGHYPGLWAPMSKTSGARGDTFSGTGELAGRTFILLDATNGYESGIIALETSDTWD